MSDQPATVDAAVTRARLKARADPPEYLPARMVNEYTYCPRLFFYEWVEGVFAASSDTVEGSLRHEKLGEKTDGLPAPGEGAGEKLHARSVQLSSDTLKVIATIDLVEGDGTVVTPVDYKRGSPRDTDDGASAWPADRAQVCVQALVLRDSGYTCNEAVLYYNATRQRVRVVIDDALVAETAAAIEQARALAESALIPAPLVDSPKCPRCSLVPICLPDETATAMALAAEDDAQLRLFAELSPSSAASVLESRRPTPGEVRRLVPSRDDLRPLYVTGHGLTVGKTGDVLQVRDRKGVVQEARLHEISELNVFGNVQLTAAAVQGLCWAEKPIAHFSHGGWFYGLTQGMGLKNVFLRKAQFARAEDEGFAMRLARDMVATKIRNQRTLLQRNHVEAPTSTLLRLRQLSEQALTTADLDALLGVEGLAARHYFEQFNGMIKVEAGEGGRSFDFRHRNRRPPRDPVNALLSLAYSLLTRDVTIVCARVGFDPYIGFYHQPRFGRPALALDIMEGFRPLVADSAVLSAINTRMVSASDFVRAGDAVSLTPAGRTGLIRAYEQRIDALVTHPLFGYRVSYRRVIEIQARLLARVVTGEIGRYWGFETR